ncbi:uncharacterized protein TM35_000092980 [Trypanosoma theileri]|uniref:Uncharacterized protein n=1 Tax=Trypanosoma theileri TaxID=67003 RepID=A0A1X0P0C7_9TRYP|nr:uncharacterized protein TM35_000092980 [Trypanosoma theileri]ORC90248.1 hypothetical protein TM35_000092980 [Trypanosoma theileri]
MVLEPGGPYPPQCFFFCQHLGVGAADPRCQPRLAFGNEGCPIAAPSLSTSISQGKAKQTSHIVVVGQAVGCQQTKTLVRRNVLVVLTSLFLYFPWISFSHHTWR